MQFEPLQHVQAVDDGEFGDLLPAESVLVAGAAPQLDEPLPHPARDGRDPLGLPGGDGAGVGEGHRLGDGRTAEDRAEAGRDARVDGLGEQRAQGGGLGVGGAGHDLFVPLPGAFQAEAGPVGRGLADDVEEFADVVGYERARPDSALSVRALISRAGALPSAVSWQPKAGGSQGAVTAGTGGTVTVSGRPVSVRPWSARTTLPRARVTSSTGRRWRVRRGW
ncbi:hypothetical protein SPURM210S_01903 [Streptomyces purpurascens]